MLKKEIFYTDFDGNDTSDVHYFHLSKTELMELESSHEGGLGAVIVRLVETKDIKALIAEFKNLIMLSYGQKSDDGKKFVKNDEIREEFTQTAAYDALFMELATDSDAAAAFINGIIPKDLVPVTDKPVQTVPQPPPPVPTS